MKMKMALLGPIEMVGDITDIKEVNKWLVIHVKMTTPAGVEATVALTHRDLMSMIKLMLRPSNLRYVLLGFGKPREEKSSV
jgi:hypothetical protein